MDVTFEVVEGELALVVRKGDKWMGTPFADLTEENAADRLEMLKRSVLMDAPA